MSAPVASLFHSLVVLGAGISGAACGGTTIASGGKLDEVAGTAGGGSRAAGQNGGQSAITGNGGAGSGSGGALLIGGSPPMEPLTPLPDAGTLAQWSCSTDSCANASNGLRPFSFSQACPVDPQRPRTASECTDSEWFQCFVGAIGGTEVLVNCSCVPKSDAGCVCMSGDVGVQFPSQCADHNMLCGCAYTGITH
jgi:hypothetical protein